MAFPPKAIANRFLELSDQHRSPISPMKLQKLVYFAHGWLLAIRDEDLISEPIEAWKFGPVVRSLYREFASYGNQPITDPATDIRIENGPGMLHFVEPNIDDHSDPAKRELAKNLTSRIWDVYGHFSPIQLSNMTHRPGSPWDEIFRASNGEIPDRTEIPRESMKRYFAKLAAGGGQ